MCYDGLSSSTAVVGVWDINLLEGFNVENSAQNADTWAHHAPFCLRMARTSEDIQYTKSEEHKKAKSKSRRSPAYERTLKLSSVYNCMDLGDNCAVYT